VGLSAFTHDRGSATERQAVRVGHVHSTAGWPMCRPMRARSVRTGASPRFSVTDGGSSRTTGVRLRDGVRATFAVRVRPVSLGVRGGRVPTGRQRCRS